MMSGTARVGLIGRRGTLWIVFQLAGTEYIVRSARIAQIEMVEKVTPVPNAPAFVRGIAHLRGEVVPILDLRVRLGEPPAELGIESRVIVVASEDRRIGLLVDSAREVVYMEEDAIQSPPEVTVAGGGSHVEGIALQDGRILLVLDLEKVIEAGIALAPVSPRAPGAEEPVAEAGTTENPIEQGGAAGADVSATSRPKSSQRPRSRRRQE